MLGHMIFFCLTIDHPAGTRLRRYSLCGQVQSHLQDVLKTWSGGMLCVLFFIALIFNVIKCQAAVTAAEDRNES